MEVDGVWHHSCAEHANGKDCALGTIESRHQAGKSLLWVRR
jgi:hypothetical protein